MKHSELDLGVVVVSHNSAAQLPTCLASLNAATFAGQVRNLVVDNASSDDTGEYLRDHYPLGFLAVPREQVVRYHGSSGTTGKPTFVAYTRRDIETWSDLVARFLVAGGAQPIHTAQIAFGYGLFTGCAAGDTAAALVLKVNVS